MNPVTGQQQQTACLAPAKARKSASAIEAVKQVCRVDVGQDDLSGFSLGHYELGKRVGTGGMGVVYTAKHRHLGKSFAIKFIRNDLHSQEAVSRFLNEIATLGCLQHLNLINAIDAGVEQTLPYCVTELLNGHDLASWIDLRGVLPIDAAAEIICQALSGLIYAHNSGIVHRDIKPSNLFLQHEGSVKLLDFGLSLSENADNAMTQAGTVLGTIEFMSPEQIQNSHTAGESSDIYSLAATMLYLISGQTPYPNLKYPSTVNKLHAIGRDIPEPLQPKTSSLPKQLQTLLLRCLSADSLKRPTANELRKELLPYASETSLSVWMQGMKRSSTTPAKRISIQWLGIKAAAICVVAVVLVFGAIVFKQVSSSPKAIPTNSPVVVQEQLPAADLKKSSISSTVASSTTQESGTAEVAMPARQTINANVAKHLNAGAKGFSADNSRFNRPITEIGRTKAQLPNLEQRKK